MAGPQKPKRKSFQEFPHLPKEQFEELEKSILKFGIKQAVIFDTLGNILDGHHRYEIAMKHGLEFPFEEVKGLSRDEKRELMISLNLSRRQLTATEWGGWFKKILELRRVKRGTRGGDRKSNSKVEFDNSIAAAAEKCGVSESTAHYRMKRHDEQEAKERGDEVPKKKRKDAEPVQEKLMPKVYLIRKNHGDGRRICLELAKKVFRISESEAITLREGIDAALDQTSTKAL